MLGHYTLIIRNEKNRIIRKIEYNDRYYSGSAMMDESFYWKQVYRKKGMVVTVEW